MSPFSLPVLGASALVASPALWAAADGTMPVDVALTRYLIALGICWALISLVAEFAFPAPGTVKMNPDPPATATATGPEDTAESEPAA